MIAGDYVERVVGIDGEVPHVLTTVAFIDLCDGGEAAVGLAKLVALYDNAATPYTAVRRAGFSYRFDVYAHLARVAEWSAQPEEGEE